MNFQRPYASRLWSTSTLAGLVGGLAEIVWIFFYEHLSGGQAVDVARGVTDSLFRTRVASSLVVPLGIAIHMGLAILLGVAIIGLIRSLLPHARGTLIEPVAVTGLLFSVWAMNFMVVLPALNPAFVDLVPYGASFISKMLFGIAAAYVLHFYTGPHHAIQAHKGD